MTKKEAAAAAAGAAKADALPDALPDAEMDVIFSCAAFHVNKSYVTVSPTGVRLTFVEAKPNGGASFARTAVHMHFQDAIALRDVLFRVLQDIEGQIAAAIEGAKKG